MGLGQGSGGTPVALGLDDDGSVWVVTHRALTEYDPATGRMVNYSDAVSDDGVNALVETALSVDRRGGGHYFSTLDIGSPGKVRYQFLMKGVDCDWQNVGEFANSAFFNMLPAGTYDLELRACGPDGQWTPESVSYEVVKRPWWYQTWWAITAYMAAALLYCVTVAHDGEEGLEAASGQLPDIIVADVMMPRLDGLELTRRLKENIDTSHIPIILLTARNSPDDRVECYRAGANGYISKPFETKVLEARIDNIISSRRKERETLHRQPDSNPVEVASSPLDKEFIGKLVGLVSRNLLDSDVDMDFVAEKMAMSRSSFYRKVKTLTGLSPMEFVKNVKLKHAYELLRTTDMSVAEVAYSSGFNNPKYFTMCFKAEFGTTPRQVRGGRTEK